MKYFKKFSIIISIAIFLMPGFVFAEVNPDLKDDLYVKLQIPLPFVATDCKLPDGSPAVCDMTDYIEGIYRLLIGTGALFAVVMIIIAGYQWIFAGGSPDKINAAKKRIFGAVIGLILALLSFIILNTITPRLVSLRLPDVEPVSGLDFVIGETCQNSERIIGLEKILKFSEGDLPVIGENAIEATTRDKAYCGYKYYVLGEAMASKTPSEAKSESIDFCTGEYCQPSANNGAMICLAGKCQPVYLHGAINSVLNRPVREIEVWSVCGNVLSIVDYRDVDGLRYYKFPVIGGSQDKGDSTDLLTNLGRVITGACEGTSFDNGFVLKVVVDDGLTGVNNNYAVAKDCSEGAIWGTSWDDFSGRILSGDVPQGRSFFTADEFNTGVKCDITVNDSTFPDYDD